MTDAKQPTAGGETVTDGAPGADDAVSPLGPLPEGVIDETPLETFDEQSFLESISEDDQRPRFGAEAGEGAIGLAIGDEAEAANGEDTAPPEEAAEELAMIAAPDADMAAILAAEDTGAPLEESA